MDGSRNKCTKERIKFVFYSRGNVTLIINLTINNFAMFNNALGWH